MVSITESQARADARAAVGIVERVNMTPEGFAGAIGLSLHTAKRILAGAVPAQARSRAALRRFITANKSARTCGDVAMWRSWG